MSVAAAQGDDDPRQHRKVRRFIIVVISTVWMVFFWVPLWSAPGMRDGIFVSSAEWDGQAWRYILSGALLGCAALSFCLWITWYLLIGKRQQSKPMSPPFQAAFERAVPYLLALCVLIAGLWGWGIERSIFRVNAHAGASTIAHVELEALVSRYVGRNLSKGSRVTYWVYLTVPGHGRLKIVAPYVAPERRPEKGDIVVLQGRRTWVGAYYDTPVWPSEWQVAPR